MYIHSRGDLNDDLNKKQFPRLVSLLRNSFFSNVISREYNVIISLSTNQLLRFNVCLKGRQQETSKNCEIVSKEKFIVKEIFVWIQVVQGRKSIVLKYFNFVL